MLDRLVCVAVAVAVAVAVLPLVVYFVADEVKVKEEERIVKVMLKMAVFSEKNVQEEVVVRRD